METVTPAETAEQAQPYADLAAELHRIADDLTSLADSGMSMPYFAIGIQPAPKHRTDDDAVVAAVDAVGLALLGRRGGTGPWANSNGYRHSLDGMRGPVRFQIYQSVSDPGSRERDAELDRLRTENAILRGARDAGIDPTGTGYSRDVEPEQVEAAPGVDGEPVGHTAGRIAARPVREAVHWRTGGLLDLNNIACGAESGPFSMYPDRVTCPRCKSMADGDVPEGRVIGRAPVDEPASEVR
jgi:hypothetical protein